MPNCNKLKSGFTFQDDSTRVNFNADPEVHTYFMRKVFAGERGAIASLCNQLLRALYDECQAQKIAPHWDILGENQTQIQNLLDNVKFPKPRRPANRPVKSKQKPTAS